MSTVNDLLQREVLPIPDIAPVSLTTFSAKDPETTFPPIVPLRPPTGAPNMLVILLDDVGFGGSSGFGGPCATPVFDNLAANGLKYTRFHTAAICSPTRGALLTGRNPHSVGMGGITEIATAAPGYNSIRPNTKATVQEILRLNGYATAQFGKCHEVPVWETSPVGPFDRWPTGSGFEYFYGFIGGEANQYYPGLHEFNKGVAPPKGPEEGYHLTEDLADKAIDWMRQQKVLTPDKPFFMYFAPGATHAPHHVPKEWADKYKGQFDDGWDTLRERIFARQKALGVIPQDADLTARHAEIPAWDQMADDLKPVLRRQMEVYAGFLSHTDHHVGRVIQALEELDILDDTLIYVIIGDNGASAEGTLQGTFNEVIPFNGLGQFETTDFLKAHIDQLGGPESYNHYAVGWAHALCTPYQWTKQVASHFGGTRNGTIVHWPNGIRARGELRSQFHHVIDVAPTLIEAARVPQPMMVHGVTQAPIEGVSMVYSFDDAKAKDARTTQYFETFGNRGIYHNGWTAVTKHRTPWEMGEATIPLDQDVWELYDTTTDWTQAHDLAKSHPDKLLALQRLWLIEATKYNVLPIDDRGAEKFNSDLAGRPTLIRGNTQILYPSMRFLNEHCVLNIKNKSHAVTAEVVVPPGGANGVIVNQGGRAGGWSFYVKEGRPKYCYNLAGLKQFYVEAAKTIPAGTHQIRMEFAYDGGGLGKGGSVSLHVDGQKVGEGRVDATMAIIFSADETTNVGDDTGSPVTNDYKAGGNSFSGTINWVRIDIGTDTQDDLISPDDRFQLAVARQ
jgi:arylsulfatase